MIHLPTGELNLQYMDFQFPCRVPLACIRSYHSHMQYDGLLGRGGWHFGWDSHLRVDLAADSLHWLRRDGVVLELPMISDGEEAVIRGERVRYAMSGGECTVREYGLTGVDPEGGLVEHYRPMW
ncbi:MAG: hypothetical protein RLZZ165_2208, partial [Bacteroidota bacterium]